MERKDTIFLFVLVGAGAWAVHANWDVICEKLGVEDFYPGRIKAAQLAKDATTFEPPMANWVVVRDRAENGEITVQGEPWRATEIAAPKFRVTCTYTEGGEPCVHLFTVDIASSAVTYDGLAEKQPAPR